MIRYWPLHSKTLFTSLLCIGSLLCSFANGQTVDDKLPYGQQPIDYLGKATDNPVSRLEQKLKAGEARLQYEPKHGYLFSLLQALDVPIESQVLVFSKTSVNRSLITPKTPRAMYFNDSVYVGWIPEIKTLEISAIDPNKGAIFYTLSQRKEGPPTFAREGRCLTCHATSHSLQVPGQLLRTGFTDREGNPLFRLQQVSHNTPLEKRWGGWYVTGLSGDQTHMGNIFGSERIAQHRKDPAVGGNVTSLDSFFDVSMYPKPDSDLVALMVLDHQAHLQNLITRFNYETRLKRSPTVEDDLLKYMFFVDEAPLTEEMFGTSRFTEIFEFPGPEDSRGRSLRYFDLKTRLFKYRLSYQIYSDLFQQLPKSAKARLYKRIFDILTGTDKSADFQKIPQKEKQAILEILRDTIDDLPDYYR